MQVSTSYLFDRASKQMVNIQNDLAKSQQEIAAQKQVLSPSDAPNQAATITRLKSVTARQDTYTNALSQVQIRLDAESSNLSNASEVLVRIKELAVQANNGSQGDVSRKAIATEMKGLRDQLLSVANSTDASGNFIFSGSKVNTKAFTEDAAGNVEYTGDQTRMNVAVGEQRTLPLNRPGTNAFVRVVRYPIETVDAKLTTVTLPLANTSSTASVKIGKGQLPSDGPIKIMGGITIPFVAATTTIPTSPGTTTPTGLAAAILKKFTESPASAEVSAFKAAKNISTVALDSTDPTKIVFTFAPKTPATTPATYYSAEPGLEAALAVNTKNVVSTKGEGKGFFTAIDDLIKGVNAGDSGVMQRGLTEMDALHSGVVMAQADVGTDMKVVEQQGAVVDDTKLSLSVALSKVDDLDMTTAVTHMQKLMLSLEAAQSTFAKTSQMSLFKYLG
jgi:flagellar hook-associated protein 3